MKIEFCDLHAQHKAIKREINEAINKVTERSDFILGLDVKLFEEEFRRFCNCKFAVGVSSGTAALFLALESLGIKYNDEVIVPDFTYIATSLAVSYTGAKPVFVDIEEDTYNIDVTKIRKAITKRTKAVIPVHLFGQPANMPQILEIAREYDLKIIEDACQAHGAKIKMADGKWHTVGAIGDIGCFSFYPSKNLGAFGDAGMIVTNDKEVYKKLLMLRDYGRISKYEHAIIGYNSRLDTLQAAILRIKLKRLNAWNNMRKKSAYFYNRLLRNVDNIVVPYVSSQVKHVYHAYAIRAKNRDEIFKELKKNNVGVMVYYPMPLHMQKAYKYLGYHRNDFPVAQRLAKEIISLPMFPHLKESQIKYIVMLIKNTFHK
jgi:dTDP-4-amino-4,6-dideoxygalactose transaminase